MFYRLLIALCLVFHINNVVVAQEAPLSVGQEITQNCASIANDMCQLAESFTQQLGHCANLFTKVVASTSALAARYPKITIATTLSALLYGSWRAYQAMTVEHYIRDARIFLRPVLPNELEPLAGNSHLKISNITIANATKEHIMPYLESIEQLKNGLAAHSYFAQWCDEIVALDGMANVMQMDLALTDAQIQTIEDFIQPRIACLGLPIYYGYMRAPYVWKQRLVAPFNYCDNYRDVAGSYLNGVFSPYEAEATKLTWQLFKYEKQLRARLYQIDT